MAYRKSLVQARYRFRKDLLRRLEREAKRNDRSMNDEMSVRLERSFDYENWREERLMLFTALRPQLEQTPEGKAALERLEEAEEKEFQKYELPNIMKGDKS
jgi:hypothetical protein